MKNGLEKQNYYYRNGIEAKDVIRDVFDFYGDALTSFEAGCVYNILKYLMRYKFKDNPKQDFDKAIIELEWLKEEISLNEETRKVNNIDNKLKRGFEHLNYMIKKYGEREW